MSDVLWVKCLKFKDYTYLLTLWSGVLLEKLTDSQLVKKFPRILWNPMVHYRVCTYPSTVRVLCQINPLNAHPTPPSPFLKIQFDTTCYTFSYRVEKYLICDTLKIQDSNFRNKSNQITVSDKVKSRLNPGTGVHILSFLLHCLSRK